MPPETSKLLLDVLEAARSVRAFAAGVTREAFVGNDLVRSSVYFKFIVIGEALNQLRVIDPDVVARISESTRIIGFRHQIAHGYGRLDDEITWRIIESKVPVLIREVAQLLAPAGGGDEPSGGDRDP